MLWSLREEFTFFDEFDALGGERSNVNDVGEARRVLNSFLFLIENDDSDSLVIAATNHPKLLDQALFRRFDDVIEYTIPGDEVIRRLIETRLLMFKPEYGNWKDILDAAKGLSPAEIIRATDEAAKQSVLSDTEEISQQALVLAILERKKVCA
ncbi:MAG: ATP-binding protein [Nodosilinea sp.]